MSGWGFQQCQYIYYRVVASSNGFPIRVSKTLFAVGKEEPLFGSHIYDS
jgi:hypothetical protein